MPLEEPDFRANIQRARQGELSIRFEHLPPGSRVEYRLENLDFAIGTYVNRSRFQQGQQGDADGLQYLQRLEDCFNAVTIPVFWHLTEPRRGEFQYEPYLALCRWAGERRKKMLGHAVFYGWDGLDDCDVADAHLDFIQPWVRGLDREELESAMRRNVQNCLQAFGPFLGDFVLNNEVLGKYGVDPQDWFSRKLGFSSLAPYFRWAAETMPAGRFYLNENSILAGANTPKYAELIDSLLQQGVAVGGIGIQGHFFGDRVAPSQEMWDKLDLLARFGLPIRVTEFGVKSTDEDLHAQDVRRLLEVCFAHEGVVGVHFWNFWQPDMWPRTQPLREAPLWNTDWSPRPAAEVLTDLVKRQWTTRGTALLDGSRTLSFTGFFGEYSIRSGGQSWFVRLSRSAPMATIQN